MKLNMPFEFHNTMISKIIFTFDMGIDRTETEQIAKHDLHKFYNKSTTIFAFGSRNAFSNAQKRSSFNVFG